MGQQDEQGTAGRRTAGRRRRGVRRRFSKEFKRAAVESVLTSGRPVTHVAAELGLDDSTLGRWVREAHWQREGIPSDDGPPVGGFTAERESWCSTAYKASTDPVDGQLRWLDMAQRDGATAPQPKL